jgi:DNA-binding NtrC family response regulator
MHSLAGRETILVVDDENIVLNLASMMLRRFGYDVLTAPNAAEALKLIASGPEVKIDVLVVAIILPGMNGLTLAEQAVALQPQLRVLYMSGRAERDLLESVLPREISFLAKPFTSLQLTRRVREVLDGQDARSRSASSDN